MLVEKIKVRILIRLAVVAFTLLRKCCQEETNPDLDPENRLEKIR